MVQEGTTAGEQVVVGDLTTIVDEALRSQLRAPAVVVVGDVVAARAALPP